MLTRTFFSKATNIFFIFLSTLHSLIIIVMYGIPCLSLVCSLLLPFTPIPPFILYIPDISRIHILPARHFFFLRRSYRKCHNFHEDWIRPIKRRISDQVVCMSNKTFLRHFPADETPLESPVCSLEDGSAPKAYESVPHLLIFVYSLLLL